MRACLSHLGEVVEGDEAGPAHAQARDTDLLLYHVAERGPYFAMHVHGTAKGSFYNSHYGLGNSLRIILACKWQTHLPAFKNGKGTVLYPHLHNMLAVLAIKKRTYQ